MFENRTTVYLSSQSIVFAILAEDFCRWVMLGLRFDFALRLPQKLPLNNQPPHENIARACHKTSSVGKRVNEATPVSRHRRRRRQTNQKSSSLLTSFCVDETIKFSSQTPIKMTIPLNLGDIYDKNISLLIGSGASFGLFPTLALNVKGIDGSNETVETLATRLVNGRADPKYTALFMHYYAHCIEPVLRMDYPLAVEVEEKKSVLGNYVKLLRTILSILSRKKSGDRKICNLFTTNYDGCLAFAAEELVRAGAHEFNMNDGTSGFKRRFLDSRNFGTVQMQTGIFGKYRNEVPQINLIQMHGSAYWFKDGDRVQIDYHRTNDDRLVDKGAFGKCTAYSEALLDPEAAVADLPDVDLTPEEISAFWNRYDALPIVNPTKWKFHETVFDEHYYQMIRYLSYELEKPNSVLVVFGFSFADEHIRNLIKRSLSNPTLQMFVCCFNESSKKYIQVEFGQFPNVQAVTADEFLDFTVFNEKIFNIAATSPAPAAIVIAPGAQA
jgi:hypothetical protein